MTAYIPLLAAIAGALVYALAKHPKISEMGRITLAAGLFALLFSLAGHSLKLLG